MRKRQRHVALDWGVGGVVVWVRGEAWAPADKLVNEQTRRPPAAPSHPLLRPPTIHPLSSRWHPAVTVLLTPHLWFDYNFTLTTQPLSPLAPGYMLLYTHGPSIKRFWRRPPASELAVTSASVKLCNCLSKRLSLDKEVKQLRGT